ncbi:M56 family metallopeptidase [Hyphomonadaceae bacterium BL14]|nr:M56 family metallopeptidase [Hyphomonadaceae bacterium BL14]
MTLAQILTAAALCVPAALCAWAAARALEPRLSPRAGVHLWRAARLALAAPLAALALPALAGLMPAPVAAQGGVPAAPAQPVAAPIFQPAIEFAQTLGGGIPQGVLWLIVALYAAGFAFAVSRAVSRRAALAKLTAGSRPATAAVADIAVRWRSRLSLPDNIAPVRVADFDGSPFVAGLRPVIFAPAALANDPACEAALAHELTHVKRGDEADRLLGEALAVLFWFNPAVYVIERRLAGARELACDAEVLDRAEPALRRDYATGIAQLAPGETAATAFLSDLPDLRRRRVKAALAHDGRRAGCAAAALAGALVLAAALPAAGLAAALSERVQAATDAPHTLSAGVNEAILDAQEAMEARDYRRALAILDGAPASTPREQSVVQRMRANALYLRTRTDEAAQALEDAVDAGGLTPEEERSVRSSLTGLYISQGHNDRAISTLNPLLAGGFGQNPQEARSAALYLLQLGEPARALPFIGTFLSTTANPIHADLNLARRIYQQTGHEAEAEAMAARIADLYGE